MNKKLATVAKAAFIVLLTLNLSLTLKAGIGIIPFNGNYTCTASLKNLSINLDWTVTSSLAIEYAEVERSFDNKEFATAGLVMLLEKPEGNQNHFQFKDAGKNLGGQQIVYYRQKLVYADGTAAYTPVTVVRVKQN